MNVNNDRWFNIKGTMIKNPSKKDFDNCTAEKIIEYRVGVDNIVKEEWWVDVGKTVISFTYSLDEPKEVVNMMRRKHFSKHNVEPHFDKSYTLPQSCFSENGVNLP